MRSNRSGGTSSRSRSEWAYLDHATFGPPPASHVRAATEALERTSRNGSGGLNGTELLESVRAEAAELLHCSPRHVCLLKSTSEGLGLLAEGLGWQPARRGRRPRARVRGVPGAVPEPRGPRRSRAGRSRSPRPRAPAHGAHALRLSQCRRPGHGVAGAARGDRRPLSRARHLARSRRGAGDGCPRTRRVGARRRHRVRARLQVPLLGLRAGTDLLLRPGDRGASRPPGRLEERTGRAWNRRLSLEFADTAARFESTMSSLPGLAGMRESLRLLNSVDDIERRALAAARDRSLTACRHAGTSSARPGPTRRSSPPAIRPSPRTSSSTRLRDGRRRGSGASRAGCASRPTSTRRAPTSRRSSPRSPTTRDSATGTPSTTSSGAEKTQSTWIAASLSPQYGPRLLPIATCAVPAAFSSKRTWPRGRSAGLSPIPSSAITFAPWPASSTRRLRAFAASPPSIDLARPSSNRSTTGSGKSSALGPHGIVRSTTSTPSAPSACGAMQISPPGKLATPPASSGRASSSHGRPSTRRTRSVPAAPRTRSSRAPSTAASSSRAWDRHVRHRLRQLAEQRRVVDVGASSARARRARAERPASRAAPGAPRRTNGVRRPIETSAQAALSISSGVASSTDAPPGSRDPGLGAGRPRRPRRAPRPRPRTARRRRSAAARPGERRRRRGSSAHQPDTEQRS